VRAYLRPSSFGCGCPSRHGSDRSHSKDQAYLCALPRVSKIHLKLELCHSAAVKLVQTSLKVAHSASLKQKKPVRSLAPLILQAHRVMRLRCQEKHVLGTVEGTTATRSLPSSLPWTQQELPNSAFEETSTRTRSSAHRTGGSAS
jgi:hypothetical protein